MSFLKPFILLIFSVLLLTGCGTVTARSYEKNEKIDISNNPIDMVTFTAKGARQLDEKGRILAGLARSEGNAVAVDFTVAARGFGDFGVSSFGYRVKSQSGRWLEPVSYDLDRSNSRNDYSVVYLVGADDKALTIYAFNEKEAVGKVQLQIASFSGDGKLKGFDIHTKVHNLSLRLPDEYVIDNTKIPFFAAAPENNLTVEAWHFTGAADVDAATLANQTFDDLAKEIDALAETQHIINENYNDRTWYTRRENEIIGSEEYQYMLTVEGDDYYVVRITFPNSTQRSELDEACVIIKNLLWLDQ